MNNNKIIMTVKLFYPVKAEYDIEVSSDITAYDLFVAINNAFSLNYRTDIKEDCYLFAENPVAFLTGDKLLSDYGLRNRTVINVLPRNYSLSGNSYLKDYDFTAITFNCAVDWSSSAMVTIGSDKGCDLLKDTSSASKVKIEIISKEGKIFLQAEKGTTIAYNGKIISFDGNSLQLYPFTFVNIFDCCFYIHGRNIYIDRKYNIRLNRFSCKDINESIGAMNYPKFIRNSRLKLKINDEEIKLLLPKEKPPKPKNNMLLKLMPTVAMIALTILLRGVVGKTNLSFILFSVCSMSMGAIVSFLTIMNDKKEYLQQIQDREQGYRKYIEDKEKEISDMRKEEWQILNRIYYRCNETIAFAKNFSGSLFDRVPEDEDFLEIRIGSGDVDAIRKIDYKPQEKYESDDDELVDLPCNISEKYRKISDAPILLQLKEANVIGVVGTNRHLYEIMKVIYFDLCIRQHYDDVTTFLITDNERCSEYDWIKWFRHINNDKFRNIVCDNQSKATVFEYLYSELDKRACSNEKVHLPHIVVFVMNDFGIKEHPVSKYIEKASLYGATFIFFENHSDYIPLGCSQLVLVDDDTNSQEVIKTPLASEIKEAGRAYLMVGNNEVFELFQSAYSGASADADLLEQQKEFTMSLVDFAGRRLPAFSRKHSDSGNDKKMISQKEAIMARITECFEKSNLKKLPNICQPPLEKVIAYTENPKRAGTGIYADLGIFDDPANQRQENYIVDMSLKHMFITGELQTGKTNILQLIIRTLAEKYTPEEVNFYIIDYSSMILKQFNNLAHVGGVVVQNEEEKMNNLFKLLVTEISERKKKFNKAGVSSYTAYKESGYSDLPLIILMIDNFTSFKELYLNDKIVLKSVLQEGLSAGISVVVTNSSVKGIEYKLISHFTCCIGLHHTNTDEYTNLFNTFRLSVDDIAGRCLVEVDKKTLDCQIYKSFQGEKETDRGKHIEAFVNKINMQYPDRKAMIIPEIPNPLIENDVRSKYFSYFTPYSFILGFDYNSLMPIKMNLSGLNMIIAGTSQPDKTNFIKYMISCINAGIESAPVQIVIFDKATVRKYAGLADKYNCITRYEISTQNMKSICSDWKKELEERKKLVLENNGDMSVLNDKPLLMMIYEDSSKEMLNDFDDSLFNYLPYKFAWMASDVDNDEISSVKAPKLYRAKSAKANFMLFGSARAGNIIDGFISVPLAERNKIMNTEIGEKDALYVNAENKTTVYRIKTILHKE